jgi:hypothetical protein
MSFITWQGTESANLYISPHTSHLILGHPSLTDQLILAEHDDKPYEYFPTGWQQADGRSALGAIRLRNGDWRKDVWQCNFLVQPEQVEFFNSLLNAQQSDVLPVTIDDRFLDAVTTRQVWIQTDRQYLTMVAAKSWWRLQFELWEV